MADKTLHARIVALNSFSQKANRLSTRKRDLKMSPKDVLNAEEQEKCRETTEHKEYEVQGERKLSFLFVKSYFPEVTGFFR